MYITAYVRNDDAHQARGIDECEGGISRRVIASHRYAFRLLDMRKRPPQTFLGAAVVVIDGERLGRLARTTVEDWTDGATRLSGKTMGNLHVTATRRRRWAQRGRHAENGMAVVRGTVR